MWTRRSPPSGLRRNFSRWASTWRLWRRARLRGFIDRSWLSASPGPIREHARPIDPSVLVGANLPLAEALKLLHDSSALFVFDRHEVLAVFTRADLQLPVVTVRRFCRWIKPVKHLRNTLAHGGNILSAEPDPIKAIELLQEVRRFAELAWERVHDDAQLWERFARTIMSVTIGGGEVQISGPGAGPWPFDDEDCWVVTACNPMGRIDSASRNARANEELEKDLSEAGGVLLPAVGRSGDWLEQSFLVRGLDRDAVLALAHSYSQRAVFRLTPACVEVVECPEGEVMAETVRDWRPLP